MANMVKMVYAARREIVRKQADIFGAIKKGDLALAGQLRSEIEQLRAKILREYRIIID